MTAETTFGSGLIAGDITARSVGGEWSVGNRTRQDSSVHGPVAGKGGYMQDQQARAWAGFLAVEASNPQRLPPADLTARVALAYEQALSLDWLHDQHIVLHNALAEVHFFV